MLQRGRKGDVFLISAFTVPVNSICGLRRASHELCFSDANILLAGIKACIVLVPPEENAPAHRFLKNNYVSKPVRMVLPTLPVSLS